MPEVSFEASGEGSSPDDICILAILGAMKTLREFKPNDRSDKDRRYAVTITELEKVYAYFFTWVTNGQD